MFVYKQFDFSDQQEVCPTVRWTKNIEKNKYFGGKINYNF